MRGTLLVAGFAALLAATTNAAEPALSPGLYRVEVRISLPNVQDVAAPLIVNRCIGFGELRSGQAFFVLSDNPLKACDLVDYEAKTDTAVYRIVCAGPNRGTAVGTFEISTTAYHGTIKMNMGGKNMTMSEVQIGTRIRECETSADYGGNHR